MIKRQLPDNPVLMDEAAATGITLKDGHCRTLREFSRLLLERSGKINLLGPREKSRLWKRHILESIAYASMLNPETGVVDIGSGNGFPGIVLAVLGFSVTLLEPRRKRFLFLRYAASELALNNCLPVCLRLEEYRTDAECIQFVARSVAPAAELAAAAKGTGAGASTLLMREPAMAGNPGIADHRELPCPPLDRRGFLVQYRV